jgi:hypothetical protein
MNDAQCPKCGAAIAVEIKPATPADETATDPNELGESPATGQAGAGLMRQRPASGKELAAAMLG